jgi:hypothetical protein
MRSQTFNKFLSEKLSDIEETLGKKGHDYATEDMLSNFKRLSKLSKILGINTTTPLGYALFMVLMKLDRICNIFYRKRSCKNESLSDSFRDLIGYALLAWAIYEEQLEK